MSFYVCYDPTNFFSYCNFSIPIFLLLILVGSMNITGYSFI
ncbi:hypothetical protein C2W64_01119 [Brevibacillus laterosporus]|nr:hypothetical protein C2W64_01119 [Brevibacillus laterosporus]